MDRRNYVFIAKSLDGYIADKDGGIEWLYAVTNPNNEDAGYNDFISKIDAIVMGSTTFKKVLSFGVEWPYKVPVIVVSNSIKQIPEGYSDKIEITSGTPQEILKFAHDRGYKNLYIDGGQIIQNFLQENLIDEICITTTPVLLGGGISLFGELNKMKVLKHIKTKVYLGEMVQSTYARS